MLPKIHSQHTVASKNPMKNSRVKKLRMIALNWEGSN